MHCWLAAGCFVRPHVALCPGTAEIRGWDPPHWACRANTGCAPPATACPSSSSSWSRGVLCCSPLPPRARDTVVKETARAHACGSHLFTRPIAGSDPLAQSVPLPMSCSLPGRRVAALCCSGSQWVTAHCRARPPAPHGPAQEAAPAHCPAAPAPAPPSSGPAGR